jgi:hypothetical protein
MTEETKLGQDTLTGESNDFDVEELSDESLAGVAGGVLDETEDSGGATKEPGGGCTINNVANC